jgi:hypothetical protein
MPFRDRQESMQSNRAGSPAASKPWRGAARRYRSRCTVVLASWLACVASSAFASQTICTFSSDSASSYREIEFIGDDEAHPIVVFSATSIDNGRRITLPPADYTLEHLDPADRRVSLVFRNPGDAALPPAFALTGTGERVWLSIGPDRIPGTLDCGD